MNVHKLNSIFKPKRIALIGVSINPSSVSGKVLSNLVGGGFKGVVYPVNPAQEAVMGIQCYPDIGSLPKTPDLAIICSAAREVPDAVKSCGEAGINGIIIMSAGFREIGDEGRELEKRIKEVKSGFGNMRIMGPNCLGIISPWMNLNASFAHGMPRPGNVAFISQSGALCSSVLDLAIEENTGFSYFVSVGNTLDVDFGDLIDYFGEDPKTESIILYVESLIDARKFMTAARSFARTKPIIVYKAGRFPASAKAAMSHTGAMASTDSVYDAAFKRAGLARVYDIGEIFNCSELLSRGKIPKGPRLAIITNAGGPGVMATDTLVSLGGELAVLSAKTIEALDEKLPPFWSRSNPVDILGDAKPKRLEKVCEIVIKDQGIDGVLVILTPQSMTNPTGAAKVIAGIQEQTGKPVLASLMGGASVREGTQILNKSGVAAFSTPEGAIRAFMTMVDYSRNIDSLYETPKDIPLSFDPDRKKVRDQFDSLKTSSGSVLSEDVSKLILQSYGIKVTRPFTAETPGQAVEHADKLGYPVVVKIWSPDITHKTDVGGVALNLSGPDNVKEAFERIVRTVKDKRPSAKVNGVSVQKMFSLKEAQEMILGIKRDPVFGTVIMAGMGGINAEIFNDVQIGFPPLNEKLALKMLKSLKIWPILDGYRGPKKNTSLLVEALIRLSYLAADYPEIAELDINPLAVTPDEVMALDARIVIDKSTEKTSQKPYPHLSLHPYPEKYVKEIRMADGTELVFRPIKPEDEPLWLSLLGRCSRETIYSRFRFFFRWESHEVATRFCYIDYDREIAIVPELTVKGEKRLLGVGRLIADPDHETVEYAVLVEDDWQNREIGGLLTDYCLEIANRWDLKRIVAYTTSDNLRMVNVFKKRGFTIAGEEDGSELICTKKFD